MAQETFTKEQFWANLEQFGEQEVRLRLGMGEYGINSPHRALVDEWLRNKNQRRSEASQAEALSIARSAKDAAWEAARAARQANTIAMIAIVVAAIAAVISLTDLYWKIGS
jgi:hypothetical protein